MSDLMPIKTGAIIFVEPENCFFNCDAYEIYGVHYFRITRASADRGPAPRAPYASITDWCSWFDRAQVYSTMICGPHDLEVYPK